MKKRILDKGLYVEGLRQTRSATAVFAVILAFIMVVALTSGLAPYRTVYFSAATLAAWIDFVILIAVPSITFQLFSFLSGRSRADFYDSLPHGRTTVFFSFFASLLTQIAVILASAGAAAVSVLVYFQKSLYLQAALPAPFSSGVAEINGAGAAAYVLLMLLGLFIASVLCCGAALFARSASGTVFNSVVFYIAILFVPRMLLYYIGLAVSSHIPGTVSGAVTGLSINIPVGTLSNVFITQYECPCTNLTSIIYTAVLAVVYVAAAALIFKKRKSESAGDPAPSKLLSFVYSALVFCFGSFFVTVFLTGAKLDEIYNNGSTVNAAEYITFYSISLLAFLIYVLVTRKKWSGVLRALPALGVGILLNCLLAFSIWGAVAAELDFTPAAENVKWISYASVSENEIRLPSDVNSGITANEYVMRNGEKYRMTDKNTIETVCGKLSEFMEAYKSGKGKDYVKLKKQVLVVINTGLGQKSRRIYLNSREYEALEANLINNEDFRRDLANLPDIVGDTMWVKASSSVSFNPKGDHAKEILDALRADLQAADTAEFYEANKTFMNRYYDSFVSYVSYKIKYKSSSVIFSVPVSRELTPKTYRLLTEGWDLSDEKLKFDYMLDDMEINPEKYNVGMISLTVMSGTEFFRFSNLPGGDSLGTSLRKLRKIADKLAPGRAEPEAYKYVVEIGFVYDSNKPSTAFSFGVENDNVVELAQILDDFGFAWHYGTDE